MSSVKNVVNWCRCKINKPASGPFIVCTHGTTIIDMVPMCPTCHKAIYQDFTGSWKHYSSNEKKVVGGN